MVECVSAGGTWLVGGAAALQRTQYQDQGGLSAGRLRGSDHRAGPRVRGRCGAGRSAQSGPGYVRYLVRLRPRPRPVGKLGRPAAAPARRRHGGVGGGDDRLAGAGRVRRRLGVGVTEQQRTTPAGGKLSVTGNGKSVDLACNASIVTINGNGNHVTLTGHCHRVAVTGAGNPW